MTSARSELGPLSNMTRWATITDDGRHRLVLGRLWDRSLGRVLFCMLNPSTADADVDDPTIRRCIGFARTWGYGSLIVVNLFSLRATDPRELKKVTLYDAIGPDNAMGIHEELGVVDLAIAAWGVHGTLGMQNREVRDLGHWHHLGLTKDGHPRHLLYLRSTVTPEPWD